MMKRFADEKLSVKIPLVVKPRTCGQASLLTTVTLGLFSLLLLGGSACTKVYVLVNSKGESRLTGTNCKLQKEFRNHQQETDYWCWAAAAHTVIEYIRQEPIQQCDLVQAVFRDQLMSASPPTGPTGVLASPDASATTAEPDPSVPTPADPFPHCCMVDKMKFIHPDEPWYVHKAAEICWNNGRADMVFDTSDFGMHYIRHEYDRTYQGPQGLTWDEIVTEICEDRPIISTTLSTDENAAVGHAVVIGGYKELGDGSRWVQVHDPGYSTIGDSYVWLYDVYLGNPGIFIHVRDYTHIAVPTASE